ncbi:MAG: PH domain-containing protein [Candidatus Odinarchaeota archaeon]
MTYGNKEISCPYCSARVSKKDEFCPNCGQKFHSDLKNDPNEPKMVFKPLNAFMAKLFLYIITVWTLVTSGGMIFWWFLGLMVSLDESGFESDSFPLFVERVFFPLYLGASILICFILALAAIIYVNTMEFQIWGHEVVVKKGVINKTEKHVPYRTVTNISTRYGIYDRLFGIGTVEIETAGKSGQTTAPEEKIEGIRNFVEIRDIVLNEIRKFRTQYATATEVEQISAPVSRTEDVSSAILQELKEIKDLLAKK